MTVTNNAKGIISIIAFEVRLADQRVAAGAISQGQVMGCVLERLNAKAKTNVDLKTFLSTMAYIPETEDTDTSLDWAEDRRESRQNVVTDRDKEVPEAWPTPGQRVC